MIDKAADEISALSELGYWYDLCCFHGCQVGAPLVRTTCAKLVVGCDQLFAKKPLFLFR